MISLLVDYWRFIIGCISYLTHWFGVKCPSEARIEGKVVIITGSNRTLGKETALELARRGAGKIVLACRDLEAAKLVAQEIQSETGNLNIVPMYCDLSSFRLIKQFVDDFISTNDRLDILINNAGISNGSTQRKVTIDGYEEHIQINHLGPLYLINLLKPLLIKSSISCPSRIIFVTSSAHRCMLRFNINNLNSTSFYHPSICYCKSKLAAELISTHLAPKLIEKNVTINTLCPGGVYTDLFTRYPTVDRYSSILCPILQSLLRTPKMGSQTIVYCAVEPSLDSVTGKHFMDCRQTLASSLARDKNLAEKTYQLSINLIKKSVNQF